jgi:hypothetical protein
MLPKCAGAADVNHLALYLDVFEAASSLEQGSTRIVVVATGERFDGRAAVFAETWRVVPSVGFVGGLSGFV